MQKPIVVNNESTIMSSFSSLLSEIFTDKYFLGLDSEADVKIPHQSKTLQAQCPNGVEIEDVFEPRPKVDSKVERGKLRRFFKEILLSSEDGELTDEMRMRCLKKAFESLYHFYFKDENQVYRVFEGLAKGTNRYNKKASSRIQDQIQYLSNLGYETFGLTITYDIKKFGSHRYLAWYYYAQHIHKALENFRKHYGLQYIWVKESTKKGYPHAHILLAFPPGTINGWKRMQNNKSLKYGWLYQRLKNSGISKVFELRPLKGNNVKYYLTKYITKDREEDLFAGRKEKYEWTEEARKAVDCYIYTIATSTRTYGMTRFLGEKDAEKEKSLKEQWAQFAEQTARTSESDPRPRIARAEHLRATRANLIKLCNNPPCGYKTELYRWQQQDLARLKVDEVTPKWLENPKNEQNLKKVAKKVSCSGCFYSELFKVIANKPSRLYSSFKKLVNENVYHAVLFGLMQECDIFLWCSSLERFYNTFAQVMHDKQCSILDIELYSDVEFIPRQKTYLDAYIEICEGIDRFYNEKVEMHKACNNLSQELDKSTQKYLREEFDYWHRGIMARPDIKKHCVVLDESHKNKIKFIRSEWGC